MSTGTFEKLRLPKYPDSGYPTLPCVRAEIGPADWDALAARVSGQGAPGKTVRCQDLAVDRPGNGNSSVASC